MDVRRDRDLDSENEALSDLIPLSWLISPSSALPSPTSSAYRFSELLNAKSESAAAKNPDISFSNNALYRLCMKFLIGSERSVTVSFFNHQSSKAEDLKMKFWKAAFEELIKPWLEATKERFLAALIRLLAFCLLIPRLLRLIFLHPRTLWVPREWIWQSCLHTCCQDRAWVLLPPKTSSCNYFHVWRWRSCFFPRAVWRLRSCQIYRGRGRQSVFKASQQTVAYSVCQLAYCCCGRWRNKEPIVSLLMSPSNSTGRLLLNIIQSSASAFGLVLKIEKTKDKVHMEYILSQYVQKYIEDYHKVVTGYFVDHESVIVLDWTPTNWKWRIFSHFQQMRNVGKCHWCQRTNSFSGRSERL